MEALNLSKEVIHTNHFSKIQNNWIDKTNQWQNYRLFIMGFMLMVQGNIIVPVTVLTVMHFGASNALLAICALTSFAVLVSNLASEKVKYSIPIFAVSTILNLLLVLYVMIVS